MKHLLEQALYEYINLDKDKQQNIVLSIIEDWLSWDYKKFNQSKFLFLKHMYPESVIYENLYRGLDVNYYKVAFDECKSYIWNNDNGKYISWCSDIEHVKTITTSMSQRTRSNYITLIKQKSSGISIMSILSSLEYKEIINSNINLSRVRDAIDEGKISEIISPLDKTFSIIGVYNIYERVMYTNTQWVEYLPDVLSKGISTYKWKKEVSK